MEREEERPIEVVTTTICKLLKENINCSKWRTPPNPSSIGNHKVALNWNLLEALKVYDNSKSTTIKNIKWEPPTQPMMKLNFEKSVGY